MSIDNLQEKIRKKKNPSVIDFGILPEHMPPHLLEEEGAYVKAYERFCTELLDTLKEIVPASRFSLGAFCFLGSEGLEMLKRVLNCAKEMGYYVFLDLPAALSPQEASAAAYALYDQGVYCFDAAVLSCYIGSDCLRPYISGLKETGKDLFAVVRTANKSAAELQDLLTGSRLVHMAAADIVNRYSESYVSKCGYSRIGVMAGASSADSLRNLRAKYKHMFLLLDGYDYPNANAKNCSYAFDRFGHGALACAGASVTAAWKEADTDGRTYTACALEAAERMKKNLTRYITIL